MIFKYNVGDENHEEYIHYEVDYIRACYAIDDILGLKYENIEKGDLVEFLTNEDLYDHFMRCYKDELEDYFEDEAREYYEEMRD